ncbi:MAG: ABC transporter ATP-binding protein [Alphaproteobacteria bacterium]|nr:ABC transporter ATP-binding protein [Alphaproteobacteria bacterium]MBT4017220.1 ABC transporter ATP-binding protein [Alphaproteobacteria bacterium]MBT5161574.1 ABC transporter ATP-binding protein [Alphaproteobacteria bacterium]
MIEISNIDVAYGKVPVLSDVSLTVAKGEIVTLIGANGAGKTTLFRALTGVLPKSRGSIVLDGKDITRMKPDRVAREGLAVVPEGRRLFGPMSVLDNLMLGSFLRLTGQGKGAVNEDLDMVFDLFPRLAERREQLARTLSGGEQQMVAISRALMARPKVILMDEPSIGLAPIIVREVFDVIRKLKESGITILLIEQNARMALKVADRAYVMEIGRITAEGDAGDLRQSDIIRKLYLAA